MIIKKNLLIMPLTRFTLRQLETFICVAEEHSFVMASEKLGITSQAVSHLVAELEKTLSFKLFERSTRKVSLTSSGQEFLTSALSIMHHVKAGESIAEDVRNRASGVVRIAAPLALSCKALPAAIAEYQKIHPKVIIRIYDLPIEEIINSVIAGDVDIAVAPDKTVDDTIQREGIFQSPWVLWCSPSHSINSLKKITWSDLQNVPIATTRREHELKLKHIRSGTKLQQSTSPIYIINNLTTALGIAENGLAVALTPSFIADLANSFNLVMRQIESPKTIREICMYSSKVRTISPATEGFKEFLHEWLINWQSSK